MDRFVIDQMKVAQTLFGDEAAKSTKDYAQRISSSL
jgi:hypothetical protein